MGQPSTKTKLVQLAGEHLAASRLALEGWLPSFTVAGFPDVDLVIFKPGANWVRTVQVKTATERKWVVGRFIKTPRERRLFPLAAADHYVFVYLPGSIERAEFYVLPTPKLRFLVERYVDAVKATPGTKGGVRILPLREDWWGKGHPELWQEFLGYRDRFDLLEASSVDSGTKEAI